MTITYNEEVKGIMLLCKLIARCILVIQYVCLSEFSRPERSQFKHIIQGENSMRLVCINTCPIHAPIARRIGEINASVFH